MQGLFDTFYGKVAIAATAIAIFLYYENQRLREFQLTQLAEQARKKAQDARAAEERKMPWPEDDQELDDNDVALHQREAARALQARLEAERNSRNRYSDDTDNKQQQQQQQTRNFSDMGPPSTNGILFAGYQGKKRPRNI